MGRRQRILNPQKIQPRWRGRRRAERPPFNATTEAVLLQIVETCCALMSVSVCTGVSLSHLNTSRLVKAHLNASRTHRDDAAPQGKDSQGHRSPRLAHEKQPHRIGKDLTMATVRRKSRNEHVGEPPLAAYPRNDRN